MTGPWHFDPVLTGAFSEEARAAAPAALGFGPDDVIDDDES